MPSQGGRRGQSTARVHQLFKKRLSELRTQSKKLHNALQGRHQREWQIPAELTTDPLKVEAIHKPMFDRKVIDESYEAITNDPDSAGTNGDTIALQLQSDYNACEERAFRARHTSLIRCFCLAHGRRLGHGHGNMWHPQYGIEKEVASFIASGGAS